MQKILLPFALISLIYSGLQAQSFVTLECKLVDCPENSPIGLYEPAGLTARLIQQGQQQPDGGTILNIPQAAPKMYLVGPNPAQTKALILGAEQKVQLWGTCERFEFSRTTGSDANKTLEGATKRIQEVNNEGAQLAADYSAVLATGIKGAALDKAKSALEANNKTKRNLVDSLAKVQPLVGKYASLFVHPEFVGDQKKSNERFDFISANYFQFADLKTRTLEDIPQVTAAFTEFASALLASHPDKELHRKAINQQLGQIPADSRLYRMALAGVLTGLKTGNSPLFFDYGTLYIEKFKNNDLADIQPLVNELAKAKSFMTGIEAPDLEGKTPQDATFALKQMRGNYVMIDFWASWCGPCRRENPHVKSLYEKYKSKGFDILGVSLDSNKERWVQAIDQDGLPWKHISDLGGWQSKHAALYGVSSIPHTVLVDKNGNIIARNLRGPALEQKLAEIFGE